MRKQYLCLLLFYRITPTRTTAFLVRPTVKTWRLHLSRMLQWCIRSPHSIPCLKELLGLPPFLPAQVPILGFTVACEQHNFLIDMYPWFVVVDHSTPASQSPHSSNPSSLPSSPPTHSHGSMPFSNFGPIGTPDSRDRRANDRWKADKTGNWC